MLVFDAHLSSCLNMLSDDRNKVFLELLSVHFFTVFYLMYNFSFVCVLYNKNQPTTAIYMISSSQEDRGNNFFASRWGTLLQRTLVGGEGDAREYSFLSLEWGFNGVFPSQEKSTFRF